MKGKAIPMTTAIIADSIFCIAVPSAMVAKQTATYNEQKAGQACQMATMRESVVISAPVERVWSVFEDLSAYASKLEPHTLSFELEPPGPPSVGQKIHAFVALGRRKVEVFSEITEVIHGKKIVETHVPNYFLRRMVETVTLDPVPHGTLVTFVAEYEPNGFKARVFSLVWRRATERNFSTTLSNLKKLLEANLP